MPALAVIFDMDGVIVDSEPLLLEAVNAVLAGEGGRLSEEDNRPFLGTNQQSYWEALIARFSLSGRVEDYVARRRAIVARRLGELPPAPGLKAVLAGFAERGVPLAVASGSERELIDRVLEGGGIRGAFAAIASGDEVARPKPDPEIFLLAARRLGVDPARCVVIEDSVNGVRAARAAGMRVVRMVTRTTAPLAFPQVDMRIDSFRDLDVDGFIMEFERR